MRNFDFDAEYDQFNAALATIEDAIADPDQRSGALDYLGEMAGGLGGVLGVTAVRERTESTPDYTDGSGENSRHAATAETMRDLAVAVRNASDLSEAALIVSSVLTSVRELVRELDTWDGVPAKVAAARTALPEGMTRDQVLARLAEKGRPIKPGTWSAYVARNQAPQAARKLGRTPLWDPRDIEAFAGGTWRATGASDETAVTGGTWQIAPLTGMG